MVFLAMRAGSLDLGLGGTHRTLTSRLLPVTFCTHRTLTSRLLPVTFFYNVAKYNARLLGFGPGGAPIARNTQHTVEKSELRSPEKVQ